MTTSDLRTSAPQRTCIGCRQQRPQTELVRCAMGTSVASVSRTAVGRGAWLCSHECFRTAERKKAFERAWKRSVSAEILRDLDEKVQIAFEGVIINMEQLSSTKG